ncbi:MAG: alanine--tRNA ligase [Candidatus Obscuribacterales bacterium]|nr:alanine--tRNA ligase [Candidatus Obscuribacterales bacterium]
MTLSGAEIRSKFVSFFKDKKGHLHLPSSSLIPDNPTLLLTSAGMVQFVPIFLGNAKPTSPPRAVTVQKCARAGGKDSDIENIGRTTRHHSFFEMLGNFSFGDYFKKEIIPWSWEFVTEDLGLDKERLIVTIFEGDADVPADEEAFKLWHDVVGVPKERIFRMSKKDNFWGPPGPTGPCGPCSEIYYDRGPEFSKKKDADPDVIDLDDDDRFVEFWNLVFMELFKDEEGNFKPLEKKNVDTGMGLDRTAMILQGKHNTFETDLLQPVLDEVCKIASVKYHGGIIKGLPVTQDEKNDSYLKIICDHARCVTFLIADGVRTSNVGRGYVLRFIIRRAARFGRLLGIDKPFLFGLVPKILEIYGDSYPELKENEEIVTRSIKEEEERFSKTIDRGMHILEQLLTESKGGEIPGKEAFNLYATYGFPVELTKEIAEEHNLGIDMKGFEAARKEHEEVSSVNKFSVVMTGEEALGDVLRESGETEFTGYDDTTGEAEVVAILKEGKPAEFVQEGEDADVVLNRTPFYAESGGQLGDQGMLEADSGSLKVLDTQKHEGLIIHKVKGISGSIALGSKVSTSVDALRRASTVLHHSTAHIFHSAVRERLGKHVAQAGSQVGPNAMRFDFSFERQPTREELSDIESMMNLWVRENAPVDTRVMSLDEAKQTGAIAMFGEKYGDRVRVVSMGDFSLEFCGGTHAGNTGDIGLIKIVSEGSIASGVRRVEAYSGERAWDYIQKQMDYLGQATDRLKVTPKDLSSQIERLQEQMKAKDKQLEELENKLAMNKLGDLLAASENLGSTKLIVSELEGVSADSLKSLASNITEKADDYIVLLGTPLAADKVSLVCAISKPLISKSGNGLNAGKLVKEVATICGGGGGGRPELAQAGGKQPEKLKEALSFGREKVAEYLKV